ncbi:MAG: cation:proton antiporter [Thermoleophilia bacterium]|nr:cation:proton antiporter [Thermoleophilia bacterium]
MTLPAAIVPGWHGGTLAAAGIVAAGVALFAAILALTHQRERAFSAAVVYLALGALAAPLLRTLGVDWYNPVADAHVGERLTEFALVVALFAAGVRLDSPLRGRAWAAPALLLLVVMPVTIGAVAAFGHWVMGLSAGAAVVLAAALAPTDPVLAGDLGVGPPGEEREDEPSVAITAEAGLNDGLAFPFVFLGLFLVSGEDGWVGEWIAADVVWGIAGGIALGGTLGWGLGWLFTRMRDRGLVSDALDGWAAIGAVLVIYGLTDLVGAYGFLAAFAGGIGFRRYERDHEITRGAHGGAATVEMVGELALILLLGSSLTLSGLAVPGWSGWLLVPVLLLVVRPLATMAALPGRWDRRARLWIGWFGVRGVGSLYYASAVAATGVLAPGETRLVVWTVIACVVTSIVVHGVTGGPLTRRLIVRHGAVRDVAEPLRRPADRR